METVYFPETLQSAIEYFADENNAHNFFVQLRWPGGVTCPYCGGMALSFISTRKTWACKSKECAKRFTAKKGTVLEDSPLKFKTWMMATWLITGAKNGISSCEIARACGVQQRTAWYLLHRIRECMVQGSFEKLRGTVECDESFIGGVERNKHKNKRLHKGTGEAGKEIVMGILERGGEMRAKIIKNRKHETVHAEISENVEPGSEVITDAFRSYRGLSEEYKHNWVDHAVKYAEGRVHTNGCENYWSLFSRMLHGTYTHIDPRHLQSYVDEQTYRFNQRKGTDSERFAMAVASLPGKHLTYAQLTERGLTTTLPE